MRHFPKSENVPETLKGLDAPGCTSDIRHELYNTREVKERLKTDQHCKCIYCECRLNGDYGHIEHFRPQKGYSIPPDNTLHTPGYYWLAYEWSNLLLSCSTCNTSYKQNHLALCSETSRRIAAHDTSAEEPLLINPSAEDPAQFVEFHEHILAPRTTGGTESAKGRHTIELLGLNSRKYLVSNRRTVWESHARWMKVKRLALIMIECDTDPVNARCLLAEADAALERMSAPDAEYSAMFSAGGKAE